MEEEMFYEQVTFTDGNITETIERFNGKTTKIIEHRDTINGFERTEYIYMGENLDLYTATRMLKEGNNFSYVARGPVLDNTGEVVGKCSTCASVGGNDKFEEWSIKLKDSETQLSVEIKEEGKRKHIDLYAKHNDTILQSNEKFNDKTFEKGMKRLHNDMSELFSETSFNTPSLEQVRFANGIIKETPNAKPVEFPGL